MLDNGMVEKRLPDGRCVDSHALALELINAFRIAGMINRIPQWQGKFSKYFYALLWSLPDDVSRLAVVDVFAQLPHGALPGEADKFFREFTKSEPFKNIYQFFETHFLGPESEEKLLPDNASQFSIKSQQKHGWKPNEWFFDEQKKIQWNEEVLRLREYTQRVGVANALQALGKMQNATENQIHFGQFGIFHKFTKNIPKIHQLLGKWKGNHVE